MNAMLLAFLEIGLHPVVPEQGSVGASGDLAPLAHLALPIVGRGEKKMVTMTKMRSAIATALLRSKQQIPHYYETIDIDVEQGHGDGAHGAAGAAAAR